MQKFCDLPYERPDVEGVGRQLETLVEKYNGVSCRRPDSVP